MGRWRILVVDDDESIAGLTRDALSGVPVSADGDHADVDVLTDFNAALDQLTSGQYDLLVLDVRNQALAGAETVDAETGNEATDADVGFEVFSAVRARRFIPIIFYTALPQLVAGSDIVGTPFVDVVSKHAATDPNDELRALVRAVFDSQLPAIHRALLDHVDEVVRDFMSGFVQPHWPSLSSPERKGDLAHLLLRRLALSLADGGSILHSRLSATSAVELTGDHVHPMRFYVVPPVGSWTTGDVVRGPRSLPASPTADEQAPTSASDGAEEDVWYIVLTPACDLVEPRVKADFVVLAQCVPLIETPEHQAWASTLDSEVPPKAPESRLRALLRNNPESRPKGRNLYLPAAWDVPDLLVDFQRIVSVPHHELPRYERIATLDSPYAEALVAGFVQYLGRLGTPDLNIDVRMAAMRGDVP